MHFIVENLLLSSKVDEVGAHGVLLAAPELVHAEGGGHVLVSHLVPEEKSSNEQELRCISYQYVSSPDPPSHVHHLVLETMFFSTVLLDLGVDILHQGVPLHQHVREGRAREDPDNLSKL